VFLAFANEAKFHAASSAPIAHDLASRFARAAETFIGPRERHDLGHRWFDFDDA
jgi:hypothetical protein